MITQAEITTATARLSVGKIKPDDVQTLAAIFRLYIKNRISYFPDLAARLAAAQDNAEGKTASKLVAILIQLEESGFSLAELKGSRSGLQSNEVGEMVLKIRFALSLINYHLPEEFTGGIEADSENVGDSSSGYFSYTPVIGDDYCS